MDQITTLSSFYTLFLLHYRSKYLNKPFILSVPIKRGALPRADLKEEHVAFGFTVVAGAEGAEDTSGVIEGGRKGGI